MIACASDRFAAAGSGQAMSLKGRQHWFVTIGSSRSAPKLSRSSVGMRERPLPQSLPFLAASAKVKFQGRPVVR